MRSLTTNHAVIPCCDGGGCEQVGGRGVVAEQVEAVVPAAEHGAALLQEQGVVHPQRQGHAGAGQLHSWHTGVSGMPCWLSVDGP